MSAAALASGLPGGLQVQEDVNDDGTLYVLVDRRGKWLDEDVDLDRLIQYAQHLQQPVVTHPIIIKVLCDAEDEIANRGGEKTAAYKSIRILLDAMKGKFPANGGGHG